MGRVITNKDLIQKALEIAEFLGLQGFLVSTMCLSGWKRRWNGGKRRWNV